MSQKLSVVDLALVAATATPTNHPDAWVLRRAFEEEMIRNNHSLELLRLRFEELHSLGTSAMYFGLPAEETAALYAALYTRISAAVGFPVALPDLTRPHDPLTAFRPEPLVDRVVREIKDLIALHLSDKPHLQAQVEAGRVVSQRYRETMELLAAAERNRRDMQRRTPNSATTRNKATTAPLS